MPRMLSRKDAAAEFGFSRQRLEKLIRRGVVAETDQGIDIDKARAAIEATLDPVRRAAWQAQSGKVVTLPVPEASPAKAEEPADDAKSKSSPAPRSVGVNRVSDPESGDLFSFQEAKTRGEITRAKLAELKYQEQMGQLLPRDEVAAKEFAVARKIRDRILGFPARLANFVPPEAMQALTNECEQLIREMQEDAAGIAERRTAS